MGYYISINQVVQLCQETGKPFYYDSKVGKNYDIPYIIVPEEYRRFIYEKGYNFESYIPVENYDGEHISLGYVLHSFPSWERVKEKCPFVEEEYEWLEDDHNLFKRALEWFDSQVLDYVVFWG